MPRRYLPVGVPVALVGMVALMQPVTTAAQPANVEVFTSVRYSDNMAQRSDDEDVEADIEYGPGVRITHVKDPGQCNSSLDADLAYLMYQEKTLDNRLAANIDWAGDCEITPYLRWTARESLRESSQDNRGTNTVDNRERKNVFSTGPQLIIPLTDLTSLISSLNWRKTNHEENKDNDSERWVGSTRLQRAFSPVMQGWLSASYSDAEFDDGEELQETSYRVGMSRALSRTYFTGNIGITELERDRNGRISNEEGTVWSVRATHQLDNGSIFTSIEHDLTDVASDIELAFGDIRFTLDQSQAVEKTIYTAGGDITLPSDYDLNAAVYYQDYEYVGSEETEEVTGVRFGVAKRLNSVLSAHARARYEREHFQPSDADADEYAGMLGLSYRRTSRLSFDLDIGHETQDSTGGGVAEYSENWIAATVTYNLR